MNTEKTKVDVWISSIQNHPASAAVVFIIISIIGIGALTDALSKIDSFYSNHFEVTSKDKVIPPVPENLIIKKNNETHIVEQDETQKDKTPLQYSAMDPTCLAIHVLESRMSVAVGIFYERTRDAVYTKISKQALCSANYRISMHAASKIFYERTRDTAYSHIVEFALKAGNRDMAINASNEIFYESTRDKVKKLIIERIE